MKKSSKGKLGSAGLARLPEVANSLIAAGSAAIGGLVTAVPRPSVKHRLNILIKSDVPVTNSV